ncbi:uncharacterized protein LOC129604140 [Betta splendens]|uniref:Uncharacterized protein LOC129604140 n=1 Tax=Betta splendens TaxID=158456 RepID=A0A9W2XT93_BETSP|nr:uncharacterized protein LOC129604140 [Betta splendens]
MPAWAAARQEHVQALKGARQCNAVRKRCRDFPGSECEPKAPGPSDRNPEDANRPGATACLGSKGQESARGTASVLGTITPPCGNKHLQTGRRPDDVPPERLGAGATVCIQHEVYSPPASEVAQRKTQISDLQGVTISVRQEDIAVRGDPRGRWPSPKALGVPLCLSGGWADSPRSVSSGARKDNNAPSPSSPSPVAALTPNGGKAGHSISSSFTTDLPMASLKGPGRLALTSSINFCRNLVDLNPVFWLSIVAAIQFPSSISPYNFVTPAIFYVPAVQFPCSLSP